MELMIQYEIKPDKVDEQLAAIKSFVAAIGALNDPEIEYTAFQLADGVSFKHVANIASEEAKARLQSQPFFSEFAQGIGARCTSEPTVSPLTRIASTRS